MELAPIAMFVYNRPVHTRLAIESLLENPLSASSDLFIFSDAAKTPQAEIEVREVRNYIRSVGGFKSVTLVERESNLGLAQSIISGVTEVCRRFKKVIVLEDDLVVSPHFLKFMNDALDVFEDHADVMHVSGCTYPVEGIGSEPFFLRVPLCWGWATWWRAWEKFNNNTQVIKQFDSGMRRKFSFNNSYHYWRQLRDNESGLITTWFVFWYATLFLRGGLALFPGDTLVRNVGFDGSGVHCGVDRRYDGVLADHPVHVKAIPVKESDVVVRLHEQFFRGLQANPGLARRARNRLIRLVAGVAKHTGFRREQ